VNETCILRLGQSPGAPLKWAFVNEGGLVDAGVAASAAQLSEIAMRAQAARRVAAILPGEQVAMRSLASPPKAPAKFRAAAGYLLEDELAEGLDALHIAVMQRDGVGYALAIKKDIMIEWREQFAAADIAPDIMTADFSLLSAQDSEAVFVFESVRLIGAVGAEGFAAERPFADGLAASLVHNEEIGRVIAYGDMDMERADIAGKPVEWCGKTDDATLFLLYAEGIARNLGPNFLQGAFRRKRDWQATATGWRRSGALIAASLVFIFGLTIADGMRSLRVAAAYNDKAASVHQEAFPDEASANPRAHARRMLATHSSNPAFLALSTDFADSLADSADVVIDRIRYNAERNEFAVNLRFSEISDLEALKQSLSEKGVTAIEVGGVRRSGAFYIGELQAARS